MVKKFMCLITISCSIWLIHIPSVLSAEAKFEIGNLDNMNIDSIDFRNGFSLLRSISAQYVPLLYPDNVYVGPGYDRLIYQDSMKNTENDISRDGILIDLTWQLDRDWFMGIYSEIIRTGENSGNDFYLDIKNPLDTDIGIIFIHKF